LQGPRWSREGPARLFNVTMLCVAVAAKEHDARPRTFRELKLTWIPSPAAMSPPVWLQSRVNTVQSFAARARAALSTFFVWAMQMGIVENNPIIGTIQPKDSKARERVLSDDELAAIWRACKDDDYGRIIRLLILLGTRVHNY
jgi:integrase